MILLHKNLQRTLFLDIETAREYADFSELTETKQLLWLKKCQMLNRSKPELVDMEMAAEMYVDRAAIYSEFAKVICVSVGYLYEEGRGDYHLKIKSLFGHDEALLLSELANLISENYDDLDEDFLCGHNVKEFDIPFLCRRMLVHQVDLPALLNIAGKKPWQVEHLIDTMELWKFGDYKNYTSLNLLSALFDIPTPKDDIDGSMVGNVYWEDNDLIRIVRYCEKDVVTVAQLAIKYAYRELISEENIHFVEREELKS